MNFPIFPPAASTTATQTDHLYFFLLGFAVLVLALVFLPILYFAFKYRRGRKADRREANLPEMKIEITWTVLPIFIAMGMFAWAARIYFLEEVPPANTMEINVVGKQWMWKVQHQEGNREINELHVPVDRAIKLTLASEDVIHSFYVPAFRVKQDVVPGRFTTEWFQPTRTGEYRFYCSEYCGADHSKMQGMVYVLSSSDYAAWIARGQPQDNLARTGENLFRLLGCSGCHVGSAAIHAPPLEGLYGRMVPLSDGTFVRADDQYLRDSILLPASQVVAGYQPVMPTYQGRITEEQLLQLIAYLKSLGGETPSKNP
jgi:cytochrome c oxidase subunit II